MKQLSWLLLLVGFAFNLNAQKAHSKTHKKHPPVYKGSAGLAFNQGLWFPATKNYDGDFFNKSSLYQFGGSLNTDIRLYKSIYAFGNLGLDQTSFSTNKVIADTITRGPMIVYPYYTIVNVPYETTNLVGKSITRYYFIVGLSYKLPIPKQDLFIGLGLYQPFYAVVKSRLYFEGIIDGCKTQSEPIFKNKRWVEYAHQYGLLNISYSRAIVSQLLFNARINYMINNDANRGIRQILNLGLGLSYKFK